jgi:hypothetical protein
MNKTILICLFNLFLCSVNHAQTPEIVYIRIQEPTQKSPSGYDAKMIVIKPDNSTETIALKRIAPDGEFLGQNGILVKTEISKWISKGFKLTFVNSSGGDAIFRTEIFMKKE